MTSAPGESPPHRDPSLAEPQLAAMALDLLAQPARWPALQVDAVDAHSARSSPWSAYWSTRLDAALPPAQARERLEAAAAAFAERGERDAELLCIAAVVEGFYVEEGSLEPLDGWIARLEAGLPGERPWASDAFEAHVMACGIGLRLRSPQHPLLARWVERGTTLLRQLAPGPGRLKLASFVAQYHLWRGEYARAALVVEAMPGLALQGALPGEALTWLHVVATHARSAARHDRAREAIDAAVALVREHGLQQRAYALHAYGAAMALAALDAARAQTHVEAMRAVLDSGAQGDQTHYWHFLAGLALLRGDTTRAIDLARTALDNSGEIGGPTRLATHHLSLGQVLLRAREHGTALACFDTALELAAHSGAALMQFTARLMRVAALQRLGRPAESLHDLGTAWAEGAAHDFRITAVWWLPEVVSELAQAAIEAGVEVPYVRRFVRQHGLPCSDPTLSDWPWPLTLRGFGEFQAAVHDEPLARQGGKTAQRPLDLLRALLAHGSAPLPVATAMQWLWPDADPAAQRKSFDAALLRLRRTLGDARLLRLEGGRLALDMQWCWSDVAALERLLQHIGSAHGASQATLQAWAWRLLDLMRGPFLDGEEADWAAAARQRYRRRFVLCAAQLAERLEPFDAQAAVHLYERALDVEPLAESLSRHLMRLHARRGDLAEALRVWRTCHAVLRAEAGLPPAQETRALAAQLGLPELGGRR